MLSKWKAEACNSSLKIFNSINLIFIAHLGSRENWPEKKKNALSSHIQNSHVNILDHNGTFVKTGLSTLPHHYYSKVTVYFRDNSRSSVDFDYYAVIHIYHWSIMHNSATALKFTCSPPIFRFHNYWKSLIFLLSPRFAFPECYKVWIIRSVWNDANENII